MTPETATVATPKPKKKVAKKKAKSRAVSTVVHQPAPPAAPRNFLQVIAEATLNPACDVQKMQALLDMQERIEERDSKKAWTVAFNALQGELPTIDKDGKIDHGDGVTAKGNAKLKTKFSTFPNLMETCKPIMKKHGFTLSSLIEPAADGARINVVSILEHIGGTSRTSRFPMSADATGGKNNQQGWGSSQQYGMRYNMIALLQIVTKAKEDVDNDGFPVDTSITEAQTKELVRLLDDAGGDKAKFCKAFGVDGIAMILAKDFEEAKMRIARYKAARAQKKAKASDFPGDRPL